MLYNDVLMIFWLKLEYKLRKCPVKTIVVNDGPESHK